MDFTRGSLLVISPFLFIYLSRIVEFGVRDKCTSSFFFWNGVCSKSWEVWSFHDLVWVCVWIIASVVVTLILVSRGWIANWCWSVWLSFKINLLFGSINHLFNSKYLLPKIRLRRPSLFYRLFLCYRYLQFHFSLKKLE